jgi:pyruvate dehydrogenase E1 component alpha subunit
MEKCPIARMKIRMLSEGIADEAELAEIESKAKADVEEAAAFALASPEPDPATVMDNVYYVPGEEA